MSILITEKTRVEAAIKKAREVKPAVKIIGDYGKFEVKGSKGEVYRVEFVKQGAGLIGNCNCPAGRKNQHCCYHLASVYPIFKGQVIERAKERACSEGCDVPAVEGETLCPDCLQAAEESRIAQQRMADSKEQAYVESILGPELVAQLNYKPEANEESALVECRECQELWPEAEMLGAGYNPVCPSCVLFN